MASGKIIGDKSLFVFKHFAGSNISNWANASSKNIVTVDMDAEVPDGYSPLAMIAFYSGNRYLSIYCAGLGYTGASANLLRGRNYHGSALDCSSPYIRGIFVRDEMITLLGPDDPIPSGCKTPFIRKSFTASVSVASKTGAAIADTAFNYSVPQGYKLFGICTFYTGHSSLLACAINPTATTGFLRIYNASGSTASGTATMQIAFIREDLEFSST